MAYLASIRGPFYALLSLVLRDFAQDAAVIRTALELVWRRKGLGAEVLAVQRESIMAGRSTPELAAKLSELIMIRRQIARRTLAGPGSDGSEVYERQLAEWSAQAEQLEVELAEQIPEMRLERQLIVDGWSIASALPAGSTLIEFILFYPYNFIAVAAKDEPQWDELRYLAFVLHAGEPDDIQLVDLGEAARIEQLVAAWRAVVAGSGEARAFAGMEDEAQAGPADRQAAIWEATRHLGDEQNSTEAHNSRAEGEALLAAVFAPLLRLGCTRLFIAPDGDLARLPFEALPLDSTRHLLDDYQISYLGVGRDLIRVRPSTTRASEAALVIADPDFDLGYGTTEGFVHGQPFSRLTGTRKEGQIVAKMLDVMLLSNESALEGTLKTCRSPRIVHIATHGFFQRDAQRTPGPTVPLLDLVDDMRGDRLALLIRVDNPLLRSGLALAAQILGPREVRCRMRQRMQS